MTIMATTTHRRTAADIVFEQLREQIMSLELLPGTKMSEAEIATRFGVSRQPVRDAFNQLGSLDLVRIQPQKATRVQHFSVSNIQNARFVRLAVEIEVAKTACRKWSEDHRPAFEKNLLSQTKAVEAGDTKAFHRLDEEFHGLIADVAGTPLAFDQIIEAKAHVDRICVLSLKQTDEMALLVEDHKTIFECIAKGDTTGVEKALRTHLSRIEKTIDNVRKSHAKYFVD